MGKADTRILFDGIKFENNVSGYLILACFALVLTSCKVSEKDIDGTYELEKFPKTTIKIKADKTFEFVKINRDPYLYPSDHPDEYYFISRGTWTGIMDKKIGLSSDKDTVIYPLAEVKKAASQNNNTSHFTFYDIYGDTVKILYVLYSNNSMGATFDGSMDSYSEDLTTRDTLEFHFYGYRPWTLINGQNGNAEFSITLKPNFRPNYFKNSGFSVKKNKLIDLARKAKFKKVQKEKKN